MLSTRLYRLLSKIALFAVIFAALAPSISHAFAAQRGVDFAQDICTSDGRKVTIQVTTTQGRAISTEFNLAKSQLPAPKQISHHLEHCPFCANPSADAALAPTHTNIVAVLALQAQVLAQTQSPLFSVFSPLPPPAQAPPALL